MDYLPPILVYAGTDEQTGGKVRVLEPQDSRRVGDTATIVLAITGTASERTARRVLEEALVYWHDEETGATMLSFDGKPLSGIACAPGWVDSSFEAFAENPDDGIAADAGKGYGAGRWNATLTYSRQVFSAVHTQSDALLEQQKAIEFDITGETARVQLAMATTVYGTYRGVAKDFGGLIGVSFNQGRSSIEGTDILVPRELITIPKTYPSSLITQGWRDEVRGLIGATNNAPVSMMIDNEQQFFDIDEMQFIGACGRKVQGASRCDLMLKFRAGRTNYSLSYTLGPPGNTSLIALEPVTPFQVVKVLMASVQSASSVDPYPAEVLVYTLPPGSKDFSIFNLS